MKANSLPRLIVIASCVLSLGQLAISKDFPKQTQDPSCSKPPIEYKPSEELLGEIIARRTVDKSTDPEKPEEYVVDARMIGSNLPLKVNVFHGTSFPPKGTVVYLCGGPTACMGQRPTNVPPEYDVVMSDYIGLGRNKLLPAPPEITTLEGQALALKNIVKGLKLTNYVIYGQSFGTSVATIAAADINKDKSIPQPKSVILEGVIGAKRFGDGQGYFRAGERTMQLLSEKDQDLLDNWYMEKTERMNSYDRAMLDLAMTNSLWKGPRVAAKMLKEISQPKQNEVAQFTAMHTYVTKKQEEEGQSYYRIAGRSVCQVRERNGTKKGLFGNLIDFPYVLAPGESQPCRCQYPAKDYDSKDHQIDVPLIYINGDMDPATTIEEARYHFDRQIHSPRKAFMAMKDGGHFSTWQELATCTPTIYEAAFSRDLHELTERSDFSNGCGARLLDNFQQKSAK